MKKMLSMYCLTLNIRRPSWILPTMQWLKVLSGHTTMPGVSKNPMIDIKTRICHYSEENDINLLFDPEHMAAILDFTHNAMS